MNFVATVNRLIGVYLDVFRQVTLWRVWLLLLLNFGLQFLLLVVFHNFRMEVFHRPVMAFVGLLGDRLSNGFVHYPGHYLILPHVFDWAKFCLGVFVEGLILGGAALVMYEDHFEGSDEEKTPLRAILSSWLYLAIAWTLVNGLMLLVALKLPSLLGGWMSQSPRRILAYQFVLLPGFYVGLLSVFYLVLPRIAIYGEGIIEAFRRSLRLVVKFPISIFFMACLVLAGPVAASFITGQPGMIVDKFRPEMVFWVLVGGIGVEIFANFLWMGTAARFLVEIEE